MDPALTAAASERGVVCGEELLQRRIRELEGVVARERRVAGEAERAREIAVREQAIALADRDRLAAQHEEAVSDREAAVRTRGRMDAERDAAMTERDAALAQRDEARRQRDDALLAHRTLQRRMKSGRAQEQRQQPPQQEPDTETALPSPAARRAESPIGVRVIPAARTVAAHLHRAGREQRLGLTQFDLWVMRILGTVAALAFISLLVMILKAFFVF